MAKPIERLRYFDGEFLRSADLETEQSYHLEMRRRLNRKLHLYGIVEGLQLANDEDAESVGLKVYSVTPGLAIDAFGRELLGMHPRAFDDDLLSLNQITGPGTYSVWIVYAERPLTPPAVGFQNCGASASDQMTRWREEYKIVLIPQTMPVASEPENRPRAGMGGVPLGAVVVQEVSSKLEYTDVRKDGRSVFAGVRAQRIEPVEPVEKIDLRTKDEPPSPRLWLTVEPNTAIRANQVIGENYEISNTDVPDAPPDTGNLKVAGNLFLRGTFFQQDSGAWRSLAAYIDSRMPEIILGSGTVTLASTVGVMGQNATDVVKFSVPASTQEAIDPKIIVSLTSLKFKSRAGLDTWRTNVTAITGVEIAVEAASIADKNDGTFEVQFTWRVGPYTSKGGGLAEDLMLDSFVYSYVAVLKPKLA